jgi:hypothetical protein
VTVQVTLRDSSGALTRQFMKYTDISAALMREVWAVQLRFYGSSTVYSDKFKCIMSAVQYSVFIEYPRFLLKLDHHGQSRCGFMAVHVHVIKSSSTYRGQFNTLFFAGRNTLY